MGFVDKLKNLFTEEDEEIEEAPVKKEVIHVDIPAPVKPKEEKEETKAETEEEKFKFPVYFDDKDFKELKSEPEPEVEKPVEPKRETRETRSGSRNKELYGGRKPYQGNKTSATSSVDLPKKRKKVFSPSPIISPVYGVLDKNYHKEDITDKKEEPTPIISHTSSKVTVDDVRNKAFGTLEEDLETTLFGKNSILFNEKEEVKEEDNFFDDLGFGLDDEHTEEKALDKSMTLEQAEARASKEDLLTKEEKERIEHDELKEDDLFNLIDSMYEKRDDA